MCGISAIFGYQPAAPLVDPAELEAITRHMAPRGPDAHGTWCSPDQRVGLGNRRLAIIDLSPDGVQPMTSVEGDLVIVFNGEIYNYAELRTRLEARGALFHTHTDTEVLLQAYRFIGPRMVELLRGMFAFTIWDKVRRRLFVARDPYGIKPLYFVDDGRTFRAASQVKALLAGGAVSPARDPAGIAGFFLLGSVPEPFTICRDIQAVRAGTWFFVDEDGRGPEQRFFSIAGTFREAVSQRQIASLATPQTSIREAVCESLMQHLVADVDVGVFLSAGIDSSALASLAAGSRTSPLRTLTLRFREFEGESVDEAPLAEMFARSIGATHVTRTVTREEFLSDLPRFLSQMDQPTIDGINTWFISKAAAEQKLKVAISGVGGDELFGSYPSFRDVPRYVHALQAAKRVPGATAALQKTLQLLRRVGAVHRKSTSVPQFGSSWAGAYFLRRGVFMPEDLPAIIGSDVAEEGLNRLSVIEHIADSISPDPDSSYGRVATLEASLYMRNQLLRDSDWASMAHSVEVRTPLVDSYLLRQLAPLVLLDARNAKDHLASATRPALPEAIRNRRKTGFTTPTHEWARSLPQFHGEGVTGWARFVYESEFAR
jgi:asparagine synthase (glutamine-hydrolysing)